MQARTAAGMQALPTSRAHRCRHLPFAPSHAAVRQARHQQSTTLVCQSSRNLVVAVDHTHGSWNAVRWTLQHLYRDGDVLHLLHVIPTSSVLMPQACGLAPILPPEEGLQEAIAEHAREYFQQNFMQLAEVYGAPCELDLVPGACNQAVSRTICRKAEELSAAVVVLSEQKLGFLEGIFQTPVSKQVADNCSCPALIIPLPKQKGTRQCQQLV